MDGKTAREKWDARYRDCNACTGGIAEILKQHRHRLPKAGRALDLAAGLGGNALFLAEQGLAVHAWDISQVAIEKLKDTARNRNLSVHTQVRDVIAYPPEKAAFDVIVVSRFLDRALCPAISEALKPGGLLFYQTYSRDKKSDQGPSKPDFLLAKGELPTLFGELEVILYQEGDEVLFIGKKH